MNKDLATLIHSSGNPLDDIFEMPARVLAWRVFDVQNLILEIFGIHWVHSTHGLDDMGNTSVLQVVDAFCSLNTPNV